MAKSISFSLLRASAFAGNPAPFCSGDEASSQHPDTAEGAYDLAAVVHASSVHSRYPITGPAGNKVL